MKSGKVFFSSVNTADNSAKTRDKGKKSPHGQLTHIQTHPYSVPFMQGDGKRGRGVGKFAEAGEYSHTGDADRNSQWNFGTHTVSICMCMCVNE